MLLFLNISGGEIFVVLVFVLMFFGSSSIPTLARSLGRGFRQIKDAAQEVQSEIRKSANEMGNDLKNGADIESPDKSITQEFKDLKDNIEN